jgi:AcrR family transcriptional regulator
VSDFKDVSENCGWAKDVKYLTYAAQLCFRILEEIVRKVIALALGCWMDGQKDEKKTKLIQVAIETIRKHGIRKTTLEDIASASGMAPTSMYYYFANKNDLLRAAISTLLNRAFDEVERVISLSCTLEEKLISTWKVLFFETNRSGFLLNPDRRVRSQIMELAEEFVSDFNTRYKTLVKKILSEGSEQGVFHIEDLEATAAVLSSGVWGILLSTVNQTQSETTEAWLDEWGKLLMNGLKTR